MIENVVLSNLFTIPLLNISILEDTSEISGYHDSVLISNDYRVLEKYPNIKNILLKNIRSGLKKLGYATEFDISTSWFTKNNKGDSVPMHNHKNSWFSAVYYYGNYDNNSGKLLIHNPLNNLTSFDDTIVNANKFNTPTTVISPERKRMIIFPSYLYHSITEHFSDLIRYSLALNIVPVENYGVYDSMNDTSWY